MKRVKQNYKEILHEAKKCKYTNKITDPKDPSAKFQGYTLIGCNFVAKLFFETHFSLEYRKNCHLCVPNWDRMNAPIIFCDKTALPLIKHINFWAGLNKKHFMLFDGYLPDRNIQPSVSQNHLSLGHEYCTLRNSIRKIVIPNRNKPPSKL